MNLADKTTIAKRAIDSISRHDDEDAAVRHAMLDKITKHVEAEREAIDQRNAERIAELTKG